MARTCKIVPNDPGSRLDRLRARVPGIDKHILLTELEVSSLSGIPRGTLSRWRCSGEGPNYLKVQRSVRYYLHEVLSYFKANERLSVRANMEARNVAKAAR